jgi:hypothetical protein
MYQNVARNTASLIKMLIVVGVFAILVYFFTIVFVAQDLYWFQKGFAEKPLWVAVYHQGQKTEYRSGQPGYDLLAGAIQKSLNEGVLRQSGIGMSEETLRDAYEKYTTVEAFFGRPVKLHANYNTGAPTQMIFPITGRHSELSVVFLGTNGTYRINGPVLNNIQPIRDALIQLEIPIQ